MEALGLNDRQRQAMLLIKEGKQLNNAVYQEMFSVSKPTASRDLNDLVKKGVLERIGSTGKGAYYVFDRKGLTKGSNGSQTGQRQDKIWNGEMIRHL
jgi:ATP-dependent DNA helicase RecG